MNIPYRVPLLVSTDDVAVNLGVQEPKSVALDLSVGIYARVGELQTKSRTYIPTTSPQTDTITADDGFDGLEAVNVSVNAVQEGELIQSEMFEVPQFIQVDNTGLITAVGNGQDTVFPVSSSGWLNAGENGVTLYLYGEATKQLPTQPATTVTPTESAQTAVASGKYTTGNVDVAAIPSNYVGSAVERRDSTDMTASGATVTAPAGYYENPANKSVTIGTAGTPTATKSAVSNNSVTVTPSVTNTTGYITGGTKTGTAVSVSASELVSGNKTIAASGTEDVTNYETVSIPDVGGYEGAIVGNYITENGIRKWRPNVGIEVFDAGWIDTGFKYEPVTFYAVPANTTITPTESAQTIGGADYMMEGAVTVNAIPSNYVGSGVAQRTSSNLIVYGRDVTVPSGYYANDAMASIPYGTEGVPTATKGAVSNHSVSLTPNVLNTEGYIEGGSISGIPVTVSASELVSGSETKTANGTYDVTNLAELVVNVGGGGGSEWTHIATAEMTVNTTSTSAASAGTISCGSTIVDKDSIIYVRVRDNEGKRAGYFAGSDAYFMNYNKANGSTSAFAVPAVLCYRYTASSAWAGTAGQYGVYGYSISNAGVVTIRRRYNSNYSLTINSTYTVDVFKLAYPTGYPAIFDI